MDELRLKFYNPAMTGTPGIQNPYSVNQSKTSQTGAEDTAHAGSFREVLQKELESGSELSFSKHAVKRVMDHSLEISDESLARLNEGVRLAGEKNLDDTLILVDRTAFLVSVKNNTVITALGSDAMKGNVFTNIDGTVIV